MMINDWNKKIKIVAHKAMEIVAKTLPRGDLYKYYYSALASKPSLKNKILSNVEANEEIGKLIDGEKPCMIARFGSGEVEAMLRIERYRKANSAEKLFEIILAGNRDLYSKKNWQGLFFNAGFLSISKEYLEMFLDEMINACSQVDVLGSWTKPESRYEEYLASAKITSLRNLEPYFCEDGKPWSSYLAQKRVLVVHPYAKLFKEQYEENGPNLFPNKECLPSFEIDYLEAVQTIAGNRDERFRDWFQALSWMEEEAMKKEFDVALIGCGAYGFPLAARLKKRNKKAVHLGGALQILFGIKGKRWDLKQEFVEMYNDHWTRISSAKRPAGYENIEKGCYW